MNYILKHFDTPLVKFSMDSGAEMNCRILSVNENAVSLLPLSLAELSPKGIETWIRHRSIPRNRAYVDSLLSAMGLSINRPMDIIRLSKGLSLNDSYWVTEEGFTGLFEANNLYDNRFSRVLGQIAFTGYGSSNLSGITSSPEFTTNGMLPKCWRRQDGKIKLYKGGTQGASNTGYEPYSEYYASQIGQLMGMNVIPYSLSKWKGILCSTCEIFTSKEISYVPVGNIVQSGGMSAVRKYYQSLGNEFEKALNDMIVFDALIFNTDRHFGNFGFLVDSHTNKIVAPAPMFDHGNSLLNYTGADDLKDKDSLQRYALLRLPCVYDYFVEEAKTVMTAEHRAALRKVLDIRLPRHSKYNLDPQRLKLLEYVLRQRAAELLK